MLDYKKRMVEVDEVLNYLSKEDILKIPLRIRLLIKLNKDPNYKWKYNIDKSLKDQNLHRDTIAFLSYLNMEYILDSRQKDLMKQIHDLNGKSIDEKEIHEYNSENIFKNDRINKSKNDELDKHNNAVHYKQLISYRENLFKKIIRKIKEFFIKFV